MRINAVTNARGSTYSELTVNLGFITIPSLREALKSVLLSSVFQELREACVAQAERKQLKKSV